MPLELKQIETAEDLTSYRQILLSLAATAKRDAIAKAFWEVAAGRSEFEAACAGLARILRMRPVTVKGFPIQKRTEKLLQHLKEPCLEGTASRAIDFYFNIVGAQGDSDGGIPYLWFHCEQDWEQPNEESETKVPVTPELVAKTLEKVLPHFDFEDILVCFAAWYLRQSDMREAIAPVLTELIRQNRIPGRGHTETSIDGPASSPEDSDRFTSLDELLIATVVESASGIEGSQAEDKIFDTVEEVIQLNSDRHRSYFLRGFANTLFGKPMDFNFVEQNVSRRAWLLAGQVKALVRKRDFAAIANLHKDSGQRSNLDEIFSHVNSRATQPAAVMVAEHVFDALWQEDSRQEAIRSLQPWVVAASKPTLLIKLLGHATNLVRMRRIAETQLLLDLLEGSLDLLDEESDERRTHVLHNIRIQCKRRRAQCLRASGHFQQGREMLKELLKEHPDAETSEILTDLGLAEGNFKWITDVRVPQNPSDCEGMINRINGGIEYYRRALKGEQTARANTEYVFGVQALLEKRWPDAQRYFENAYYGASKRLEEYKLAELYKQIQLYYALALILNVEIAQFGVAQELLTAVAKESDQSFWPEWLLKDAIHCVELEPDGCFQLVEWAAQYRPHLLTELIHQENLVLGSPVLRQMLQARAASHGGISSEMLWKDNLVLLNCARRMQNADAAGSALDALETLAVEHPQLREPYIQLISNRSNYDSGWSSWDALESLCVILQEQGNHSQAATELLKIFYHHFKDGELSEADGILERINGFGLEEEVIAEARSKMKLAMQRATAEPTTADKLTEYLSANTLSILFIGGHETQERYDGYVRAELASRHPRLSIEFMHTGWGGGWGSQFDQFKTKLPRFDLVVVMRFIRTQLGRSVRDYCGQADRPWFPCTGHGRDFIIRAVERAAQKYAEMRER